MSSGSESDDEYVPGEPEQVSEEESADEETDMQFEKEQEHKTKKRKAAQESNSKKKRRTRNTLKEPSPEPVRKEPKVNLNPEEEKKRQEDLWAMFLDGTDSKPKVASKVEAPTTSRALMPVAEKAKTLAKTSSGDDDKAREKRIFEFAGETIVVENNVIKEKLKTPAGTAEDRSQRWALLVDVTIPHDENLVKAEKDKLSKYLDLAHEVTTMWDVDSTIIVPIVVSANGLIVKSPDQHLKRLSLDGWIKRQIQKVSLQP